MKRYVVVWKRHFRMVYIYFGDYDGDMGNYCFRFGMLNDRPNIGSTKTRKWMLEKRKRNEQVYL